MPSTADNAPTSTTGGSASAATEAAPSTGSNAGDKAFWDVLGPILGDVGGVLGSAVGLDPRATGQTVAQILNLFGIGGPGKEYKPATSKSQALSDLQQVVAPHLDDPVFARALALWLQAAAEPVQAHKQGKEYTTDMNKSWFSDALDSVGGAISGVASHINWGDVAQDGIRALPSLLALL